MGDVRVRKLDDDIIAVWKQRARAHGRSLEAELRATLEQEATRPWRELAGRLETLRVEQSRSPDWRIDSTALIRDERDSWG